jgi:hypothetical protein
MVHSGAIRNSWNKRFNEKIFEFAIYDFGIIDVFVWLGNRIVSPSN